MTGTAAVERSESRAVGRGRFVLGEPLGSGGTARVFRCFDQHLRVERAIKLLRGDDHLRRELRPRLHAEARAMAAIRHPNVLGVYDFGAEPDCDWVVMEIAEGGSLDDRLLREGRLAPATVVDLGLQILSGLAAAHAANVVHRDVKPQNVLLDQGGNVRLADFGIALFSADRGGRITQAGVAMGSFAFMPPEQRIDARGVDARADIYATGATLYVLLTGRTPMDLFAADERSSRWTTIPASLATVLVKATRFDPAERFQTAFEMAAALADAASRESLLDRATAHGAYAIFSQTTFPGLAAPTHPVPPPPELPPAEPTRIVPELQEQPERRRFRWMAAFAFAVPVFAFVSYVGRERGAPPPEPPPPEAAAVEVAPPAVEALPGVERPPAELPVAQAPAPARPEPARKERPSFAHPELVGAWAANWGEAMARVEVAADGRVTGRVAVGFGEGRSEPMSGRFRWDGDRLRIEDTRYRGRITTIVLDELDAARMSGTVEDSPGERVSFHRDAP